METIKKWFHTHYSTWLRVLLFALGTGVYTGLVMSVPGLEDTSFQDIGITEEWWVLFAILVVLGCRKNWEAAIKCFVFFLVSQPVVYLTEVLCGTLEFRMAWYYYSTIWLKMTFLTLPGGFIAYWIRKKNLWGSAVLGIGNTILMMLGVYFVIRAVCDFPHHLLSAVYCFALPVVLSFTLQSRRKCRVMALGLPIVLSAGLICALKLMGLYLVSDIF